MFLGEPFGGLIPGARGATLAVLLRTGTALTGRQIHRLASGGYSLRTIQEVLKVLVNLGLVQTATAGRATLHTINLGHYAVAPLRILVDPMAAVRAVIGEVVDGQVHEVILFGSVARGEATPESDIDLAVIADPSWSGRIDLQDTVADRLGNRCDVVVFTEKEFNQLAITGEPVIEEIKRDGIALYEADSRPEKNLKAK